MRCAVVDGESERAPYAPLRVYVSENRCVYVSQFRCGVEVAVRHCVDVRQSDDALGIRSNGVSMSAGDDPCSLACECDDDYLHASMRSDDDDVHCAWLSVPLSLVWWMNDASTSDEEASASPFYQCGVGDDDESRHGPFHAPSYVTHATNHDARRDECDDDVTGRDDLLHDRCDSCRLHVYEYCDAEKNDGRRACHCDVHVYASQSRNVLSDDVHECRDVVRPTRDDDHRDGRYAFLIDRTYCGCAISDILQGRHCVSTHELSSVYDYEQSCNARRHKCPRTTRCIVVAAYFRRSCVEP